ncbi:MAG: SGNH/GDSL hydrolase family protein [Variovorax sp.]
MPSAPVDPTLSEARARWHGALDAFADADKAHTPASGGVLFVGSSSIRLWSDLAQDFRRLPLVINRGFGGSTLWECSLFVRELVLRYRPKQVVLYAGENDLAQGQTPLQVLESFERFQHAVRAELPGTKISYISIKPSPAREALMKAIRQSNRMISFYAQRLPDTEFIDVYTPMIDADGEPRAELFRADRLHLNHAGYALWRSVIAPHLPGPAASAGSDRPVSDSTAH